MQLLLIYIQEEIIHQQIKWKIKFQMKLSMKDLIDWLKYQTMVIAKGNKEAEGKIYEVLVEGTSKNDDLKLTGRTRNARLVNFEGGEELIGNLVNVKIIKANSFSLIGEVVK